MGTRSTTRVYNGDKMILALYCQFDGFFDSVGQQLADFCQSRPMVNGISGNGNVFNGPQCFAAQLVAHLKDKAGLWYITGEEDQREEFNYAIYGGYSDKGWQPLPLRFTAEGYGDEFDGKPEDFKAWHESLRKDDE